MMTSPVIVCKVIVNAHECEGSIAEANDCLRSVRGKLEWFDRKQRFCPHLISVDDSNEVMTLIHRINTEESPVLEYDNRFRSGHESNISNDLQLRVKVVCDRFQQIRKLLQHLYNNIDVIIKKQGFLTM